MNGPFKCLTIPQRPKSPSVIICGANGGQITFQVKKYAGQIFTNFRFLNLQFMLYLVGGFSPTPLKNMLVKMGSSSPIFGGGGENSKKYLSCHHLGIFLGEIHPKPTILLGFSAFYLSSLYHFAQKNPKLGDPVDPKKHPNPPSQNEKTIINQQKPPQKVHKDQEKPSIWANYYNSYT